MKKDKTINQKIMELEKSTDWFYSDEFNLDDAVKKYKEAIALANELKEDLDGLKNEIEVLAENFSK